jgi:hypothetical protein
LRAHRLCGPEVLDLDDGCCDVGGWRIVVVLNDED